MTHTTVITMSSATTNQNTLWQVVGSAALKKKPDVPMMNMEPSGTHTLKMPIGTPRLLGGNHSLNSTGITVPMQA